MKSSSLVPANDPTLLFTNAGMNQFKDVFLGKEKRDYIRATTSQKCVRAGGKHNDLENVGKTARHHTFFEMLGNFSFGDYFKSVAIPLAWNLVTKEYGLDKAKLWVTIYRDDEEAFGIWSKSINVPSHRIFRLGEKDNFWAMGDTGPCGPCSELHYDQGAPASEQGHTDCQFPCDCGRYVEIWNLVFMQYNRDSSGTLTPLPRPSIDTGMGLERIAAVLQGKTTNYETDLLKPLILQAAEIVQKDYGEEADSDVSLRVIADHSRAAAFLISDGIIPSNDGRGYVLRKILRRGIRHGRLLGMEDPFLYQMTGYVAELMKGPYLELLTTREYVAKVVKNEEQRFSSTIRIAIDQLSEAFAKIQKTSGSDHVLPGDVMFKFYDTFGLPLDLMQELADETGVKLDEAGFTQQLEVQRSRGKLSWLPSQTQPERKNVGIPWLYGSHTFGMPTVLRTQSSESQTPVSEPDPPSKTQFLGYDRLWIEDSRIVAIVVEGKGEVALQAGETGLVFLDKTPFYAETGGQVGDTGSMEGENSEALVHNTYPPAPGFSAHETKCIRGVLKVGDIVKARVDVTRRLSTEKNHTATHLLHASLRNLVGTHVKQAGSLVAPDRLRFDFTHYAPLSAVEISEIENLVNATVMQNSSVTTSVKDLNDAIAGGAMALFGEKYGSQVRVVSIEMFSKELCGGTHVGQTGEIGLFKIVSEAGVAAGVRRVEAITGHGALVRFREDERLIGDLEELARGKRTELLSLVEKHQSTIKTLEKEVEELRYRMARSKVRELLQSALVIKDVKILTAVVDGLDKGGLRNLADELKAQLGRGVVVLATAGSDKVALVAAVTSDLTSRIHAGKLVKEISSVVGGSGGGKPEIAEAGGKDPSQLGKALEAVGSFVERSLAG